MKKFLVFLAKAYIFFVARTSKITEENTPGFEKLKASGGNFIYAFWHGRQLIPVFTHRSKNIAVLISRSADGGYIASVTKSLGFEPVRGSTTRDAVGALLEIIKKLRAGQCCAFTPDGPRGPLRKVSPGVIYAARKSGRPVVTLAFGARCASIFGRWDEFIVPRPFNRIVVMHGEPLYFSEDENIEAQKLRLEEDLNYLTAEADRRAGFTKKKKKVK